MASDLHMKDWEIQPRHGMSRFPQREEDALHSGLRPVLRVSLDVTLMLPVRLHPHSPHFLSGSKEDPLGYVLEWTAEGEGLERAGQKVGGLRLSFLL